MTGEAGVAEKIMTHRDMKVWQSAMAVAMRVYEITKSLPAEERYSLVDQIRRSSRSVAANIAEAWGRRRYQAAFVNKLNEAECEAYETQTWIEFCLRCNYVSAETAKELDAEYRHIISRLVVIITNPEKWILGGAQVTGKTKA
jgi:four helix bundle protein